MVTRKKPAPQHRPADPDAISVATGLTRQAVIALACAEHGSANTWRADYQHVCNAEALLKGALEIVEANKERLGAKL